jgi:hypothetical protein
VTIEAPLPKQIASVVVPRVYPTPQAFIDAGCKRINPIVLDCAGARIEGIDVCEAPFVVLDVTLEPPATIVQCTTRDTTSGPGIRQTGCMNVGYMHLFVATSKGFTRLDSREAFAAMFGPVTSKRQAIAFAIAMTGDDARAEPFSPPRGMTIHEPGPAQTIIVEDGEGYHLRLFHGQVCGCSHPFVGTDYLVTRQGTVTKTAQKPLWEDPKSHGLCVD